MQITARRMYYTKNGGSTEYVTTATSGVPSAWLYAVGNVNFTPNSNKSGWIVSGDVQVKAAYEVYITASHYYYATIYIYEGSTLIGSTTASIKEGMWSETGGTTATVDFTNKEIIPNIRSTSNLSVKLVVDFTDFTASGVTPSGQKGIGYTTVNGVIKRTESDLISASVSELPPLLSPPAISNLVNANKYKNQNDISASTNSISLSWSTSAEELTESWYKVDSNAWVKMSSPDLDCVITGLNPGQTYSIQVQCGNSAGYGNVLNITVRTRHAAPVVTLELTTIDLETLSFDWLSDKDISSAEYRIDNGEWISTKSDGISGSFTTRWFEPKSTHTIYFRATSTDDYDSVVSNIVNAQGTTYDMGHITSIGDCIFGNDITINITSESNKLHDLKITTENDYYEFMGLLTRIGKGTYTFTPNQSDLDSMYKCYSNTNSIPIYFELTTIGQNKSWKDTVQQKSLQLTGIAKTAHVGVDNVPKRAQVCIGVDNQPKRAVTWLGVDDTPRRCI